MPECDEQDEGKGEEEDGGDMRNHLMSSPQMMKDRLLIQLKGSPISGQKLLKSLTGPPVCTHLP